LEEMDSASGSAEAASSSAAESASAASAVTDMMSNLSIAGNMEAVLCKMPVRDDRRFTKPSDTIAVFESHDTEEIIKACFYLRHILSNETSPPVEQVVSAGCLPHLIRCISESDNLKVQFEAAWAITNIASSDSRFTRQVVESGAVPHLLNLLRSSPSWEIMDQAVWALGNIAGDGVSLRNTLVEQGCMDELIRTAQRVQRGGFPVTFIRNLTWTMSNMFRFKPHIHSRFALSSIPIIKNFLTHADEEVVTNTIWCFSYLTESDTLTEPTSASSIPSTNVIYDAIFDDDDILLTLRGFLSSTSLDRVVPSMRVFGNICTGSTGYVERLMRMSIITAFVPLLSHRNNVVRKESFWTMSNIAAGTSDHVQALMDSGVISRVYEVRRDNTSVKKEAGWVVCNAVSVGTEAQVRTMAEQHHIIESLISNLEIRDTALTKSTLASLETVVRVGISSSSSSSTNPFVQTFIQLNGANVLNRVLDSNDSAVSDAARSLQSLLMNQS